MRESVCLESERPSAALVRFGRAPRQSTVGCRGCQAKIYSGSWSKNAVVAVPATAIRHAAHQQTEGGVCLYRGLSLQRGCCEVTWLAWVLVLPASAPQDGNAETTSCDMVQEQSIRDQSVFPNLKRYRVILVIYPSQAHVGICPAAWTRTVCTITAYGYTTEQRSRQVST